MAAAASSGNIYVNLLADTKGLRAGFAEAETVVKGFESVLNSAAGSFSGSLGALQIPTSFNDAIKQSVGDFAAFDEQMRNVNSMIRMNSDDFKNFEGMVLSLNGTLGTAVGAADAAKAAYQAVSHGFSEMGEAAQVIGASMVFSTAALTDAGQATKLVAGLLESYNLKASDATHVTDILTKTIASGSLTGKDLQMTLGRLAPVAHENGISMEEMSSAVAALSDKGIRTNQAVTALVKIIGSLGAESKQAKETLASVGLTADQVRESMGENGLVATMRMIEQATGGAEGKLKDLFGKGPALNAFFALAGKDGGDKFDKIFASMKDIDGNAAEAAAEQMKGLGKQVDLLKVSLENVGIMIGGAFAPALINLVGFARTGVDAFSHLDENVSYLGINAGETAQTMGDMGKAVLATVAGVGTLLASIMGISAFLEAGSFVAAFESLELLGAVTIPTIIAGVSALGSVLYAAFLTPMGLAITACVAVAAALAGVVAATYSLNEGSANIDEMTKSGVNLERQLHALNDAKYRGGSEFKTAKEEVDALRNAIIDLEKERDKARDSADKQKEDQNSFGQSTLAFFSASYAATKQAQLDATEEHARQLEIQGHKTSDHLKKDLGVKEAKAAAEKKAAEEALAAKNAKQKEFFDAVKKFDEDLADHQFKTRKEAFAAIQKIQKDHAGMLVSASKDKDEQILGSFHHLDRETRKLNEEQQKETELAAKKATQVEVKHAQEISDSKYKFHKITYEEYIKQLRDQEQKYKDFGDAAGHYEEKIATIAKTHMAEVKAEREKQLRNYISTTENNLEAEKKVNKISWDQEIAGFKNMLKDKRLADEEHSAERARIGNKIASLEAARDAEAKARADAKNKIDQELSKERIKNADEELAIMKKKVEFGIISESQYTDAVKKTYEMKKAQIELETKGELEKGKKLTGEEQNEIKTRGEMKLRDLQRQTSKEYADNINDINKAKQGNINKTEEQIKKEKEYQALISNQMKGGTMGLDEFVKQSNAQFDSGESGPIRSGQAFGAGGSSAKAAFLKEQKDRLKAMNKLGFDQDSLKDTGHIFGNNSGHIISENDRWMMNATGGKGHGPNYGNTQSIEAEKLAESKRQTALLERIANNASKREANAHSAFKHKNDMDGSNGTFSK